MDAPALMDPREDEIDLGKYFAILRKEWWKVALLSLAVGVATLLYMFTKTNLYQATAVITPEKDERRQSPALGALASFGINIGGPSSVEDLESLFKSSDLAVRVFKKYNLWPIIYGDKYDSVTGRIKTSSSGLSGGEKDRKPLGDWDAIRAVKGRLKVSVNKKAGTVSVSFESPSAEGSANIVKYFLDEGKSRLQEEALDRAIRNKKFIEEQTRKTVDALNRDRLYSLLGQEVEREMMARIREKFGFMVVDSPRVPDLKSGSGRARATAAAILLFGLFLAIYFIAMEWRRQSTEIGLVKREKLSQTGITSGVNHGV